MSIARARPFGTASGNDRFLRIPALPGTQRERLLRVDLARSLGCLAMPVPCELPSPIASQRTTAFSPTPRKDADRVVDLSARLPPSTGGDRPQKARPRRTARRGARDPGKVRTFGRHAIARRHQTRQPALVSCGANSPRRARPGAPAAHRHLRHVGRALRQSRDGIPRAPPSKIEASFVLVRRSLFCSYRVK